jgi:predicted nucleic acid-binding protein
LFRNACTSFWAVATRPKEQNGLGFSIAAAEDRLGWIKRLFPPLRDERGIREPWESLVVVYAVRGKPSHDARLVAAMQRHGLSHLLTFNGHDFARYAGLSILDAAKVLPR